MKKLQRTVLLFLSIIIAASAYVAPASAADTFNDDSNSYRTRNNIIFYDPNDSGCSPDGASSAPASSNASAPPEDYARDTSRGVTLNKRTLAMLVAAEVIYAKKIGLTQGSYNAGGVGASAGTHDGGGALDVNIAGLSNDQINNLVKSLRMAGFAAWHRIPSEGPWEAHVHAIAIGDKELSSGAADQVKAYFNGKNGLSGNGPDTSPDIGRPLPEWAKQYGTATDSESDAPLSGDASQIVCCPTGDGSSGTAVDIGNVSGDTGKQAFAYFVQKGLSADQAAGIVGNLMKESGGNTLKLDPKITNPIGAYGIAQWLGGRKDKLKALPKYDTVQVQLDYLWSELTGGYKKSVLDPIKTADRGGATRIFLEKFEIPCTPGAGCNAEYAERKKNADTAYNELSGMSFDGVAAASAQSCADQNGGAQVNADGYTWPLLISNKADMYNGYKLPCTKCHHDGTAAFDLANKGYDDPANVGTVAVAITAGKIARVSVDSRNGGCSSIQFLGDDGYYYWYGHTLVNETTPGVGVHVEAGTPISKIGPPRCNNGGAAHLHIDRGSPKGRTAGEACCRDKGFIDLMNSIYKSVPN